MNITFLKREGQFRPIIREHLKREKKSLEIGELVTIKLTKHGGYPAKDINIVVSNDNADTFETFWKYNDPTRFPARIRATASALKDCSLFGEFSISHKDGNITVQKTVNSSVAEWSNDELKAAVEAYFYMLNEELEGREYNKAAINRNLRENVLKDRSKGSVEFRMQNISATLQELCHPHIKGYLPRGHVGTDVKDRIKEIIFSLNLINESDYNPTPNPDELEGKVKNLLKKPLKGIPRGETKPKKVTGKATNYYRDPLIKAWVLRNANGVCELCDSEAPFVDESGEPFLETHHVIFLADGGTDTIENSAALCPNCHRGCHHSKDAKDVTETLKEKISRIK